MPTNDDSYTQYREEVESLLALTPAYPDLLNRRGLLRQLEGDNDGARKDFTAALSRNPDYEAARVNLAFLLGSRDPDAALNIMASVARDARRRTRRYVHMALLCFSDGRLDSAYDALTHASSVDPSHPLPEHWRAYFLAKEGKAELACQALRRCCRLPGAAIEGYEQSRVRTGDSLNVSRLAEGIDTAKPFPGLYDLLFDVARWLAEKGNIVCGRSELRTALLLDPRYAPYAAVRGQMELAVGKPHRAERWFCRALQADPRHARAYEQLARVYIARDDTLRAESYLSRAIALRPDYPDLRYDLAVLSANAGRLDEAASELRACLAIHPAFHMARFRLGEYLLRMGDNEGARRQFERLPPDVRSRSEVRETLALAKTAEVPA